MADTDLISFHRMLINDEPRTRAYRDAIFKVVKKGDVVADIGGGSGILSLFAAQAGARKVYCIERTGVIVAAQQLAAANGLAQQIVFLNEDAMQVELDEKLDVIISEQIGKAGVGDNMGQLVGRFRDEFLKAGGRILPATMEVLVAPVDVKGLDRDPWLPPKRQYGLDFSTFAQFSNNRPMSCRIATDSLMADGQLVFSYDAPSAPHSDAINAKLTFSKLKPGKLGGFVSWFTSVLADGIEIHNKPPGTPNWDNYFYMLPEPVDVDETTSVELSFRASGFDEAIAVNWIWDTTIKKNGRIVAEYRQSSMTANFFFESALFGGNVVQS